MSGRALSNSMSGLLLGLRSWVYLAWDYVWLYICVAHVRWFIKFHDVPFLGDLLRRMTMLSGASDTNASLCLFLRWLYTFCPGDIAFDRRERVFARIFLERQYLIAAWLVRTFGLRILPPLLRPLYSAYYGRAIKASEFVNRCIDDGTEQLVILGAGFDSTAYRLRNARIRVKDENGPARHMLVYEVDRPSVQQRKVETMKAGMSGSQFAYYTEGVRFVECEFGTDSIYKALLRSGFSTTRSTAVLWEGVTYYLNDEALAQTLTELSEIFMGRTGPELSQHPPDVTPCAKVAIDKHEAITRIQTCDTYRDKTGVTPRATMFMDYMSKSHTDNDEEGGGWLWDLARDQAVALGTSFLTGFTDVEAELAKYGLKVTRHIESEFIRQIFERDTSGYHQVFRERNATMGHERPKLALVECEFQST